MGSKDGMRIIEYDEIMRSFPTGSAAHAGQGETAEEKNKMNVEECDLRNKRAYGK